MQKNKRRCGDQNMIITIWLNFKYYDNIILISLSRAPQLKPGGNLQLSVMAQISLKA